MSKRVVHYLKYAFVTHTRYICNRTGDFSDANLSWRGVTCKNCLRHKKHRKMKIFHKVGNYGWKTQCGLDFYRDRKFSDNASVTRKRSADAVDAFVSVLKG